MTHASFESCLGASDCAIPSPQAATEPGLTTGFFHPVGRPVTPHDAFTAENAAKCWDTSSKAVRRFSVHRT